ncbi:hypothetical protein [Vulcanisaeta sp. JCM 14467]
MPKILPAIDVLFSFWVYPFSPSSVLARPSFAARSTLASSSYSLLFFTSSLKVTRGESQVEILSEKFTIDYNNLRLVLSTKNSIRALRIYEKMKNMYEKVSIGQRREHTIVSIPFKVIARNDEVRSAIHKVLCSKLRKVRNERTRMKIIHALMRLSSSKEVDCEP